MMLLKIGGQIQWPRIAHSCHAARGNECDRGGTATDSNPVVYFIHGNLFRLHCSIR